jgi:hypothetical protein
MEHNNQDYSIGIVTYVNRYHTYFKPNIEALLKYFPNKQIICVINGYPDKTRHLAYVKEATRWLSTLDTVQYITFEDHQSLAKCWNWILIMSCAQNILFLNDDVLVRHTFRQDFENLLKKNPDFFAINSSFSHFLLNKEIVKKLGWFDERFLGIGYEDSDYLMRLAQKNIQPKSFPCRGIVNFIAPELNPSFKNISSITSNKYSSINREFMEKKWFFNHLTGEDFDSDITFIWNDQEHRAKLKNGMDTPLFYDYALLDNNLKFASRSKSFPNRFEDGKKKLKVFLKNIWV